MGAQAAKQGPGLQVEVATMLSQNIVTLATMLSHLQQCCHTSQVPSNSATPCISECETILTTDSVSKCLRGCAHAPKVELESFLASWGCRAPCVCTLEGRLALCRQRSPSEFVRMFPMPPHLLAPSPAVGGPSPPGLLLPAVSQEIMRKQRSIPQNTILKLKTHKYVFTLPIVLARAKGFSKRESAFFFG